MDLLRDEVARLRERGVTVAAGGQLGKVQRVVLHRRGGCQSCRRASFLALIESGIVISSQLPDVNGGGPKPSSQTIRQCAVACGLCFAVMTRKVERCCLGTCAADAGKQKLPSMVSN